MATVSFFIDNRYKNEPKPRPVKLYLFASRSQTEKKKFSLGISLMAKNWMNEKQRVKLAETNHLEINQELIRIETEVNKVFISRSAAQWPEIVFEIEEIIKGKKGNGILEIMDQFIMAKSQTCGRAQLTRYKLIRKTFEEMKPIPTFESMDHSWGDRYVQSLIDSEMLNSTIAKRITFIKTFMKWARLRGYHTNMIWEQDKIGPSKPEKQDVIALLPDEIEKLKDVKLSEFHDRIRWLFLFSCHTGARYSDVISFKKTDIINNQWRFEVKKMRKQNLYVTIPFVGYPEYAKTCLEKLNYKITPITSQYIDRELKEIARIAGLDRNISLTRFSGSTERIKKGPVHKYLTFHCGRRTFISILLNKGVAPAVVMKLTGISNFKTLSRYLETYTEDLERALTA